MISIGRMAPIKPIQPPSRKNGQRIAEKAADLKNVSRSDYGGASSDRIFQIAGAVRTWGLVAAALLLFVV